MEPIVGLPLLPAARGSGAILQSLHSQLRAAILDGRLKPGLRLPSTRDLATAYGISRNTAVAAYEALTGEGYLIARRGSGTSVAALLAPARRRIDVGESVPQARLLSRRWRDDTAPFVRESVADASYWFRLGVPDVAGFPFALWNRLTRRVERRLAARGELNADPQGLPALRAAIATHVSFTRAVACSAADIVVTAGAAQAFDLLARALVTPRTHIAVEEPGYPPLRRTFAAHGAQVCPVPVDSEGMVTERIPARCQVVCVTPSHQFPLGCVMSPARRLAVLEFCRRRGAVVIEDDYDGEFRFADRPLDALQTLDRAGCVFYVGTFSKSLLPELRLGYIVAPDWALNALIAAKQVADGHCNPITQSAVALMIGEGHMARHVTRMRRLYQARRTTLLRTLRSDFVRWLEPLPAVAGLHIAARFLKPTDDQALLSRAHTAGVRVASLRRYHAGRQRVPGLVFGYGAIDVPHIEAGLRRLCRVMEGGGVA